MLASNFELLRREVAGSKCDWGARRSDVMCDVMLDGIVNAIGNVQ